MSDKYGYIYLTKNLINGKGYVGLHKAENLDVNYDGSGRLIIRAINKYGRENFINGIIEWCLKDQIKEREIFWTEYFNTFKKGYNITKGGDGLLGVKQSKETINKRIKKLKGQKRSNEQKKKISDAHLGLPSARKGIKLNDETKQKIKNSLKGKKPWNKGKINIYSEETLKQMSDSIKKSHNKPETKEKLRNSLKEWYKHNDNYFKGKHHSEETRQKISKAQEKRFKDPKEREKIKKGVLKHFKDHPETKIKIGISVKKKLSDPKIKEKLRNSLKEWHKHNDNSFKGKHHSEEARQKISKAHKGKKKGKQEIVKCPYCNKIGGNSSMKRWHFDNCKIKQKNENSKT